MKKNKIFIFDMDGVIVDTLDSLYKAYVNFLKKFGKVGSQEEFAQLNGPKIEEIIDYLKKSHRLTLEKDELLEVYNKEIALAYSNVSLMGGVVRVLELLKKNRFKIALASSSKRKNVEMILDRFNLSGYFDFIVSGDEVSAAKPSPEIYELIKNRFKNHEYYVIEDSINGAKSALGANTQVVFFNAEVPTSLNEVPYKISEMNDMTAVLEAIKANCMTIAASRDITIVLKNEDFKITDQAKAEADLIWSEELKKNPSLFNGKIVNYLSHHFKDGKLFVDCCLTDYKYFLVRIKSKKVDLKINPLAVSGILIDKTGKTLLGKRSRKVTEYCDFYEFVPSGGMDCKNIRDGNVLFMEQLKQEACEEVKMPVSSISRIVPLGLVLDDKHAVYDICGCIHVDGLFDVNVRSEEYSETQAVSLTEIPQWMQNHRFVPTSLALYALLKRCG